ncbi:MAG: DUF2306 domain-containing protein [Ignavibacteria bacterium]
MNNVIKALPFSFRFKKFRINYLSAALGIIYLFFCYLMLKITLQYIPYDTDAAFLKIKQEVINVPFYKIAFFTHVYTAMLVLPAGFTQFSKYFLKNFPLVHKTTGYIYAIAVTFLTGPSGFFMGIYANGGLISQTAFCTLAVLWIYFTVMAVIKAKQKNFKGHRNYLVRSFALALSAITLRAWKYILVLMFEPRPMDVYQLVSWLGWIPNIIIAEIIIHKLYKK